MLAVQFVCVFTLMVLVPLCAGHPSIRLWQDQHLRNMCDACGNRCNKCEFGVAMSQRCGGIAECAKGPGEDCGGPDDKWGECGEGLVCSCNKCMGCSLLTFDCYSNKCPPHQTMLSRHLEMLRRFPIAK